MVKDAKLWAACQRVEWVAEGKTINYVYSRYPIAALDNFRADLKLIVEAVRNNT